MFKNDQFESCGGIRVLRFLAPQKPVLLLVVNYSYQALELALRFGFGEPDTELLLVKLAEPLDVLRTETRLLFSSLLFALRNARKVLKRISLSRFRWIHRRQSYR